jgi:glycosyltransferase involved in cell wall biosynthesis
LLNSRSEKAASPLYSAFANPCPRVVFLTDIPTPYIIEIMRELSLRIDLVCLFCAGTASRGMNWNFERKLEFRHFVIGGARIKRHAGTTDYYISPRIFWRLLRARPDAIISSGFSIPSFYAYLYCKLAGAKLIVYSDGTSVSETGLGWLQRVARKVLVPRVAAFIAKSRPAADRFEELGAKGRIFLAPHTTNLAPLLAIGASKVWSDSAELRLLSVGRLIPQKGVEHLIRALAAMRPVRRPVSLTIVGSGPQEAEVRIPIARVANINDARSRDALLDFQPDFVVTALDQLVSRQLIGAMPIGLDAHYGILPQVKGWNATEWSLLEHSVGF